MLPLQGYPSSLVAGSCILAARKVCNIEPIWNKEMENLTYYSFIDLLECMNLLLGSTTTIKLGDEIFVTETILGRAPHALNECSSKKQIIKIASKNNTQSFVVNQNGISLFTPSKEGIEKVHGRSESTSYGNATVSYIL